MKVKPVNIGKLDRIIGGSMVRGGKRTGDTASASRGDTASFSQKARLVGLAGEAVMNAPDIRMDKVGPIKDALDSGRYDVASLDVADMILRRALVEGKQFL